MCEPARLFQTAISLSTTIIQNLGPNSSCRGHAFWLLVRHNKLSATMISGIHPHSNKQQGRHRHIRPSEKNHYTTQLKTFSYKEKKQNTSRAHTTCMCVTAYNKTTNTPHSLLYTYPFALFSSILYFMVLEPIVLKRKPQKKQMCATQWTDADNLITTTVLVS